MSKFDFIVAFVRVAFLHFVKSTGCEDKQQWERSKRNTRTLICSSAAKNKS